jgi:hypothetical protein
MSVGLQPAGPVRQHNIMQPRRGSLGVAVLDRLLIRPGRATPRPPQGFSMGILGWPASEILHHAVVIFRLGVHQDRELVRCWWDWRFWTGRGLTRGRLR